MSTKLVPLGKGGPLIPRLGLGVMGLGIPCYGAVPSDEDRFKLLDRALELGYTHWDSSDLYGDSEALIGKWFKRTGKRDQIFIATKFGFVKGSKSFETNSSYQFCKDACAESLKALGVDHIDLYYMHHANPKTPIEETMRALAELQAEGKIKHIGLSAVSSASLLRAVKIAPVAAVQTDYSPFFRDIETEAGTSLLATCRSLGIAVVAAMPLNRGLLTSSFVAAEPMAATDTRATRMPRFNEDNASKNRELVGRFQQLAERVGCTTSQLSLAWLLKQGEDIIPIPGTKRIQYLEENWKARDVVLDGSAEKEVDEFLEKAEIAGDVIPAQFRGYYYQDTVQES